VGGPVQAATELLEKAFRAERAVLAAVAACKQPQAPALQKLVAPVGAAIMEGACRVRAACARAHWTASACTAHCWRAAMCVQTWWGRAARQP
jgi:hypothetical protein